MDQPPAPPVPHPDIPLSSPQPHDVDYPRREDQRQHSTSSQPLLSAAKTSLRRPSQETNVAQNKKNEPQIFHSRFAAVFERLETGWILETCFLLLSAVCMVAIVIFLAIHHNSPLEDWTFYFSLNTVVATLGVLYRSTLIIAVSAALAQGKWIWYRKRNSSLRTFESIDAASRETLGSFKLLWHMRGRHLVSAGAIVMALAFLVEPFLQAVIDDYGRLVSTAALTNATIAKSTRFDGGTQCVTSQPSNSPLVETTPDFAINAAFYNGLGAATNGKMRDVTFHCASGNCTWPDFASLAVCSSCHDVSTHLKEVKEYQVDKREIQTFGGGTVTSQSGLHQLSSFTVHSFVPFTTSLITTAPGTTGSASSMRPVGYETAPILQPVTRETSGYTLEDLDLTLANYNEAVRAWRSPANKQGNVFVAKVTVDHNQTINFKHSETLLAAFTMIRGSDEYVHGNATWPQGGATATECGLSLCLKAYRAAVTKGVLNESVIASASSRVHNSWLPRPASEQAWLNLSGIVTDPGTPESNPVYHKVFLYRNDYQLDASSLNRSDFSGPFNITQKALLSTTGFLTSLISDSSVKLVADATNDTYVYGSPLLQPLYESKNASDVFESLATSLSNALRDLGTEPHDGTTKQWIFHYRVRWGYLALPVSLILIGALFFVASVIESHKAQLPAWKSDSMPTIVHGPDESLRQQLRMTTHDHSLHAASKTVVGLEEFPDGYALTVPNGSSTDTARPITPSRDEEGLSRLKLPATPRTHGSTATLVEPLNVVTPERIGSRSVSPALMSFDWEPGHVDLPPSPLNISASSRNNH